MKTALSIAGSDPSGGAGIQADLKTMTMHGVYAMSAITALTAQNTTGVQGVLECSPEFLALQLDCIFSDIVPDAVKTGMVSSAPLIRVIADRLTHYQAQNLVVDPVMVSTSGSRLLEEEALEALRERLLPLAILITPNIPEAEVLSGLSIQDEQGMEEAARIIGDSCGCAVLCKGGTPSRTPTMCFITGDNYAGFGVSGSIIPTPTAPAARSLPPSPQTLPWDFLWRRLWPGRRSTSPVPCARCWILAPVPVP